MNNLWNHSQSYNFFIGHILSSHIFVGRWKQLLGMLQLRIFIFLSHTKNPTALFEHLGPRPSFPGLVSKICATADISREKCSATQKTKLTDKMSLVYPLGLRDSFSRNRTCSCMEGTRKVTCVDLQESLIKIALHWSLKT